MIQESISLPHRSGSAPKSETQLSVGSSVLGFGTRPSSSSSTASSELFECILRAELNELEELQRKKEVIIALKSIVERNSFERSRVRQTMDVFANLMDDLVLEIVLDVHKQWKTGALAAGSSSLNQAQVVSSDSLGASELLECPMCAKKIAHTRYAPHLERCMGKGGRAVRAGTRRNDNVFSPTAHVPALSPTAAAAAAAAAPSSIPLKEWIYRYNTPGQAHEFFFNKCGTVISQQALCLEVVGACRWHSHLERKRSMQELQPLMQRLFSSSIIPSSGDLPEGKMPGDASG
jgi:hypothetical protein